MNTLFQQILQLLITSPGNLIYHLVLAFALMAGLQAVMNLRQDSNRVTSRRYLLGFIILLSGQVILFVSSALIWQKIADPQQFLPVIDRAITAISLLWIAWMWIFPLQNRSADTWNLILSLVLLVFAGISLAFWIPQAGAANFNQTAIEKIWTFIELVIVIAAIGGLFYRRQGSWNIGLGFFLVMLVGTLGQLFWSAANQDFAPIIRLTQLCVYPLLPSLARNLSTKDDQHDLEGLPIDGIDRLTPPRKQLKVDSRTAVAWLQVAKSASAQETCPALIQAVGRSLTADLCFLIVAPDNQTAVLQFGYDLIRETSLPGSAVMINKIPQIANAMQRSKPVRIPFSGKEVITDLISLASSIGIKDTGHLLAAPIKLPQVFWGGIMLISPYSKYEWTKEDQATLVTICQQASPIVSPAFSAVESQPLKQNNRLMNHTVASELEQAREEQKLMLAEIDRLREQINITPHLIEVESLLAAQVKSRETILRLETDNQELRVALQEGYLKADAAANYTKVEADLRAALDENTRIQAMLVEAKKTIKELQERTTPIPGIPNTKENESIIQVVQKIRQPIFSIVGYADLLNNEAKSQLSPTARMYLERIESSIDRMGSLLDEYNLSSFETSPVELAPQELNLNDVLEQVLSNLSRQLQEKKISLQVDISDSLPMVYADKDALHQILLHLLQNAGNATPPDGTIHICMKVDPSGQETPYMMLQVTDEGGGIVLEDLSRVFTRKSNDKLGKIPGLGESGLGLSITKTLVEAHGGRIWIDSDPGKTTTITLLLPLHANVMNGASQSV